MGGGYNVYSHSAGFYVPGGHYGLVKPLCRFLADIPLDTGFCLTALDMAFQIGKPEIFNTDQGSQFTSSAFNRMLKDNGISISMDGLRGMVVDNFCSEVNESYVNKKAKYRPNV